MRLMTMTIGRWTAITGQLFTVLFVQFSMGIELPLLFILPAILAAAALNTVLTLRYPATARLGQRGAGLLFTFDISQLGYLLAITGGLNNPFSPLILLPVGLAATILSRTGTIALTVFTLTIIGLMALAPWPLPWFEGSFRLPAVFIAGEWAGLSLAAILLSIYAYHVAAQARRRADALQAAQLALAREQRLSALGGQAAAAAHLLGSPLGTIRVIAKELVHEFPEDDPLQHELQVMLGETRRCRDILAEFGRKPDERVDNRDFERAPIFAHLQALADQFPRLHAAIELEKQIDPGATEPDIMLTPEIRHGLINIIDNALQFARHRVLIRWRSTAVVDRMTIEDDGPGFSPEVLDWLGEPYLSSRKNQGGLGLGVFIAITLLERSGAKLQFSNTELGACVTVTWKTGALEVAREGNYDE